MTTGPMCRCGSRNTKRIGKLERECQGCGRRWHFRIYGGHMLPFSREMAELIDREREPMPA